MGKLREVREVREKLRDVGIGFILLTYGNLLQSLAVLVTNKSQYAKFPWIYSADFI